MNPVLDLTQVSKIDIFKKGELDSIFFEFRNDIVESFDTLIFKSYKDIRFWHSPIFSRNTYVSDFLDDICRLILAKKYIESGKIVYVICYEYQRKFFLENITNLQNCKFRIKNKRSKFIKNSLVCIKNIVYSYTFISRVNPNNINRLNKKNIIDTVIYQNSFVNNKFLDRHFPGLKKNNDSSIFLARLFISSAMGYRTINKCLSNQDDIFVKEQFFGFIDYFRILLDFFSSTFYLRRLKIKNFEIRKYDFTHLMNFYINHEGSSVGSLEGIKSIRFFSKSNFKKIKMKKYLTWYENQEHDHISNAFLKKNFLFESITGYRGFHSSYSCLNLFPLLSESLFLVLPDKYLVISHYIKNEILETCKYINVDIAPALRYKHFTKNFCSKNILIALPVNELEAKSILNIVSTFNFHQDYRLTLKPHPATSIKWIESILKDKISRFKIVTGSFESYLSNCKLLISSASSVCIQAIHADIPLIIIGDKNFITQNPLPSNLDCRCLKIAYDKDSLEQSIAYLLSDTKMKYLNQDQKNRLVTHRNKEVFFA